MAINTISYAKSNETDGIYYDVVKHVILGNTHYIIDELVVEDDGCSMSHDGIEDKYFATVEQALDFCKNTNDKSGLPRWYRVIDKSNKFEQEYIALDKEKLVNPIDKLVSDPTVKWY